MIEFQKLNCSCNDCLFMVRDLSRLPKKGVPCPINYGTCEKLGKKVSFIPNHFMLENQQCFKHRKETDKLYLLFKKAKQQYIHFSKLIYKDETPVNLLELLDNSFIRLQKLKLRL